MRVSGKSEGSMYMVYTEVVASSALSISAAFSAMAIVGPACRPVSCVGKSMGEAYRMPRDDGRNEQRDAGERDRDGDEDKVMENQTPV